MYVMLWVIEKIGDPSIAAMAMIVFVMKLWYGLDDEQEHHRLAFRSDGFTVPLNQSGGLEKRVSNR